MPDSKLTEILESSKSPNPGNPAPQGKDYIGLNIVSFFERTVCGFAGKLIANSIDSDCVASGFSFYYLLYGAVTEGALDIIGIGSVINAESQKLSRLFTGSRLIECTKDDVGGALGLALGAALADFVYRRFFY